MVNVLLVEDSKIMRDMVKSYIDKSQDYMLIAELENAANAEIICTRGIVDLILMDVCTADDESGLKAAAKIKKHSPNIRIIIMTSMPEYSFIQKAKDAGCDSFWYKEYGETELLDIMDRTMRGESVYPSDAPVVSVGHTGSNELTEKELTVLRQLALGYKYDEIADNLSITTNTVKYHIKNLLTKTGYRSTLQLVVDAVSKRLILPKF
jgi:DNA-binding NarL/FixJ family response regulator